MMNLAVTGKFSWGYTNGCLFPESPNSSLYQLCRAKYNVGKDSRKFRIWIWSPYG